MGLLDGQVAFITGAGRGIGKAISEAFAREGAAVAAAARSEDEINALCKEITDTGGRATPIVMDLNSEESIKLAIAEARRKFGQIDLLVNNAAIIALAKVHETSTQTWDDVMNTNVRGVFLTCREVLPEMMERRSGRIINVGSTAGRRGYPEQGAYCASKHALVGLSKVLAIETQSHGIRVHMLSPGGVLTGLSADLRSSRGETEDSPEWMTTEEIANAALYLCTQTGAALTDDLILRRYASEPWR
ncbi:MAG: SDR family oxidoreductase [Armatimonadetes bacterium]|nr:SDR family oxidoreductase [Armatimonadota bacterium]